MEYLFKIIFILLVLIFVLLINTGIVWLIVSLVNFIFTTNWHFAFWQYVAMSIVISLFNTKINLK